MSLYEKRESYIQMGKKKYYYPEPHVEIFIKKLMLRLVAKVDFKTEKDYLKTMDMIKELAGEELLL